MRKFSQKHIKNSQYVRPYVDVWVTRDASNGRIASREQVLNKFEGMTNGIEELKAVVIPGYKTRG
ncbi:hypothetical protein [Desertivirga xinjiangensis]|uniref:hypothetical protein n=1 Tax=Desertivirga xinjiangensis TaxID=539206 RepID=UPI00210CF4A5|nr:hypothetical protein [Pedobacter xinjiangensis]